jgi:hypothetical protein
MKKYLFLLLALFSFTANAAFVSQNTTASNIYYVATNGNDTTGNGSASKPWATLPKACTSVTASGSTIYVRGVGVSVDTVCNLNVGVSIQCEFTATYLKATAALDPMIKLNSATQGINGNQSITNCTLDGNTLTGTSAVEVKGRSNVVMKNLIIKDWLDRAVDFHGLSTSDSTNIAPTYFGIGNEFAFNTITNSSRFAAYGRGQLQIGGQDGIYIHDNNMNQSGRGVNGNGWLIKYLNDGFNKNVRIIKNTFYRESFVGDSFNFSIELWHSLGGTEIAFNNIYPMLDIAGAQRGTSTYSFWIHNNTFGDTSMVGDGSTTPQRAIGGVDLEHNIEHVIIDSNTFRNLSWVMVDLEYTANTTKHDITISNNVAYNIWGGLAGNTSTNNYLYNVRIINNTLYTTLASALDGFNVFNFAKNVEIRNNIVVGFTRSPVMIYGGVGIINELIVNNNIFNTNGHSNTVWFNGSTSTNYQELNNLTTSPSFTNTATFDFSLQVGSPAIGAGFDVGIYQDIFGRVRLQPTDIGAYQYNKW